MRHFQEQVPKAPVCNSWKEIAAYLGRGVRTAQRWEHDLQLPVHRPKGTDRSAVLAFPAELDDWLQRAPLRDDAISRPVASGDRFLQRPRELCQRVQLFSGDVRQTAHSQRTHVANLSKTLHETLTLIKSVCGNK